MHSEYDTQHYYAEAVENDALLFQVTAWAYEGIAIVLLISFVGLHFS